MSQTPASATFSPTRFDRTVGEKGKSVPCQLRNADGAWFRYVPPGFDLKEPVRALAASGTRVFMATGSSVTVLDTKDDSYTTIDAARGLPVSEVSSLYADDRYLWIASPGLITRLDYTKELR